MYSILYLILFVLHNFKTILIVAIRTDRTTVFTRNKTMLDYRNDTRMFSRGFYSYSGWTHPVKNGELEGVFSLHFSQTHFPFINLKYSWISMISVAR